MAILENCVRFALTEQILSKANHFSCGNSDLDEFFSKDAITYAQQLMGKTYVFIDTEHPQDILCAFTVSNASIFTNYLPNSRKKKIGHTVPQDKRDLIYPAVLIGRLGVNQSFHHKHIGSDLMDYIKTWFTNDENKTGCRYLVVDAYNDTNARSYYERNGFQYMFSSEEQEKQYRKISNADPLRTRMMYFDLIQVI